MRSQVLLLVLLFTLLASPAGPNGYRLAGQETPAPPSADAAAPAPTEAAPAAEAPPSGERRPESGRSGEGRPERARPENGAGSTSDTATIAAPAQPSSTEGDTSTDSAASAATEAASSADSEAETPATEAEPTPPPPPPRPIDLRRYDPKTSFSRLAHPAVAAQLRLTDEQRAGVTQLMAERAQKLAGAPEDQWIPIILENEEKLKAILRPDQLDGWPEKLDQKRIQFLFRYQLWEDVLQWFADQAGLSLVLDSPPPGTFNYSDPREYTPAEAIDLLNGVLMTRGYTLIRRDQMLMVIDLRGGVPRDLVPTVRREDLAERGKHEFVKVEFPIGKKEPERVLASIRPLMSAHGTTLHIAAQQIMIVLDTAGALGPIGRVIDAVPEPTPPKNPLEDKVKELDRLNKEYLEKQKALENKIREYENRLNAQERPVSEIYELKHANLDPVVESLKRVMGSATIIPDARTKRLFVFATPSQQNGIKAMLARLDAETPIDEAPILESYSLQTIQDLERYDPVTRITGAQKLVAALKELTPNANISIDTLNKNLLAFASPTEQVIIRQAVEKLTGESASAPGESSKTVEIYTLHSDPPANLAEIVEAVARGADVTVDAKNRRLMIVATPEQHLRLLGLVARLDDTAASQDHMIMTYPVTSSQRSRFLSVWRSLYAMPDMQGIQMLQDNRSHVLTLWATPAQHAKITAVLNELQTTLRRGLPDDEPRDVAIELEVHRLTTLDGTIAARVLEDMVPDAQVRYDETLRALIVIGIPAEQQAVRQALAQLQSDAPGGPDAPELRFYAIEPKNSAEQIAVLRQLVPRAQLTERLDARQLIVIATASDHEQVAKTLDQFVSAPVLEKTLEVYSVDGGVSDLLLTLLREAAPDADIQVGPRKETLIVTATAEDHVKLATTLSEMAMRLPAEEKSELKVYPLTATQRARFDAVVATLQDEMGPFRVINDGREGELSIWATPSQHERIAATLQELAQTATADRRHELFIHPIRAARAGDLETMLRQMYPDARIQHEANTNRLLIWSLPEESASIRATLDAMDAAPDPDNQRRFATYELKAFMGYDVDPATGVYRGYSLLNDLRDLVPGARLSIDRAARVLLVWGTAEEQRVVAAAVENGLDDRNNRAVEVYPLTKADARMAQQLLTGMFNNISIVVDTPGKRLVITASAADHQAIARVLSKLQPTVDGPNDPILKFYALKVASSPLLISGLKTLAPDAEITIDAETKRLMVIASPSDQNVIMDNLYDIQSSLPEAAVPSLVVYEVDDAQRRRFTAFLESASEDLAAVRVVDDNTPGALSIWANLREHNLIAEVLDQLKVEPSPEAQRRLQSFLIAKSDPTAVTTVLEDMFPDVKFVTDAKTSRILAYASASDLAKVEQAVGQVDADDGGENQPKFESFVIPGVNGTSISSRYLTLAALRDNLTSLAPGAKMTISPDYRQLVVWGTPHELDLIRGAMQQLTSPENTPTVRAYPLMDVDYRTASSMLERLAPSAIVSFDNQGGRMVVLASPADHAVISEMVKELDTNQLAPNAHVLRVYDVKEPPSDLLARGLQDIAPRAEIVVDRRERKLIITGNESDQRRLAEAIAALNETLTETSQRRYESFTIKGIHATSISSRFLTLQGLQTTLAEIAPLAKVMIDGEYRKLVAFGTEEELELIRKALEGVGRLETTDNAPRVETYDLRGVDPGAATTLLKELAKEAQISVDSRTGHLVALATPEEHAIIRDTLDRLSLLESGAAAKEIRYYTMAQIAPKSLIDGLGQLIPGAELTLESDGLRLMAIATTTDHERIASAIARFEATVTPEDRPRFESFEILGVDTTSSSTRYLSLRSIQDNMRLLVPGIQLTFDSDFRRLIAFGSPRELDIVRDALKQLGDGTTPENTPRIEVFDLSRLNDPRAAYYMIYRLAPTARINFDYTTHQIVVWGLPRDLDRIAQTVQKMTEVESTAPQSELQVYALKQALTDSFLSGLKQVAPKADIELDSEHLQLIVVGKSTEHDVIKASLAKIEGEPGVADRRLLAYPIGSSDAATLSTMLGEMFPTVKLQEDARSRRLLVWAKPAEHAAIAEALEAVTGDIALEATEKYAAYPLGGLSSATILEIIEKLVPYAEPSVDSLGELLIVYARADEHALVRETMERLRTAEADKKPTLTVYPCGEADPEEVADTVRAMLDEEAATTGASRFSPYGGSLNRYGYGVYGLGMSNTARTVRADRKTKTVVVLATPQQHERIRGAVEALAASAVGRQQSTTKRYALAEMTATTAISLLSSVVPNARLSPGASSYELIAYADNADQAKIQDFVDQLRAEGPQIEAYEVRSYILKHGRIDTAERVIERLLTGVYLSRGADPNQLLIWARPFNHARVERLVAELDQQSPPELAPVFETYPLRHISTTNAVQMLNRVRPSLYISVEREKNALVVWASPAEQEVVRATLTQLDTEKLDEAASRPILYTLDNLSDRDLLYAVRLLARVVPGAVLSQGTDPTQIVAFATPKEHEQLAALVEQLAAKSPATTPVMTVYTLETVGAATAIKLLGTAVPNAELSVGADASQLVAWARPSDHADIAKAIEAIEAAGPSGSAPTMQVYDLTTGDVLSATQLLATVTPDAVVRPGGNAKQLLVWARPADHQKVGDAITKLNDASPEPELKVYTLQKVNVLIAVSVARGVAPEALCFPGSDPSQLYVWARKADHDKVRASLDTIEAESTVDTAARFQTYALQHINQTTASQILRTAVPEARVVPGQEVHQLLVWARPTEHAKIESLLVEVDIDLTDTDPRTTIRYDVSGMGERNVFYVTRFLRTIVPSAELTLNVVDPTQLLITARPKEHRILAELIEQLTTKDPATAPVLEVYSLETTTATRAMTLLRSVAPSASFSLGADPSQLVVWARPLEHADIKAAVERLSAGDLVTSPTLEIYRIESGDVAGAIARLLPIVPNAELSLGNRSDHLVAWARPGDHKKIADTVAKLAEANPKPVLQAYAVRWINLTAAESLVSMVVPDAQVTVEANSNELLIRATPEEHTRIAQTLTDLDVQGAEETRSRAVAYDLSALGPRGSYFGFRLLSQAVPTAQILTGVDPETVIVWATPREHDRLSQIVDELTSLRSETTPTLKVHALKSIDASQAIAVLTSAFPTVVFSVGSDARQLCVWAKPDYHGEVEKALASLTEADTTETAPSLRRYTLRGFSYYSVYRILAQLTPQADLLPSADLSELLVWAGPEDHEKIAKTLETLNEKASDELAPTLQTYALKGIAYETATRMLPRVTPTAIFSLGANAQQLVVWARPTDHVQIRDALDRMSDKGPADSIPTMQTYTIRTATAADATRLLASVAPQAQFGYSSDPHELLVWAIPSDHEAIRQAIETMSMPKPDDAVRSVRVYSFESAGAANAQTILRQALPQAIFSIGSDPSKLIVWGYPDDHATIETALQEIEADSWTQGNRVMSVYPMRQEDTAALLQLLDPVLQQNAQFIHDAAREVLIVWANAKHHEAIRQTVEQYVATLPPAVKPVSRVYRFQRAQPYSVMSAIPRIAPAATVTFDYATTSLVVTALPEDHLKIAQLAQEMDLSEPSTQRNVRVHRVTTANVRDVYTMLRSLYMYRDPQFVMALDPSNRAVIALASPEQHLRIEELIGEIERGTLGDPETTLALYPLKNIDSYSAVQILNGIMASQGFDMEISIDRMSNQLVAIARPEQHKLIASTLDTLRTEDRQVEVFRLEVLDPATAEMAVYRLFTDESYVSAPSVDADRYSNLLFIRGTRDQIELVRETLIKMGERNLSSSAGGLRGRLRSIRIEGDTSKLIEELKRAWPEMGDNRLEVIHESQATVGPPPPEIGPTPQPPSAPETIAPRGEAGAANPNPSVVEATVAPAAVSDPSVSGERQPWGDSGAPGETGDLGPLGPAAAIGNVRPHTDSEVGAATVAPTAVPLGGQPVQMDSTPPALPPQSAQSAQPIEAVESETIPGAPVFILIGNDGSLTLASDDLDALDRIETLLKQLTSRTSFEGRDYTVFRVEHVAASQVVQSMQIILRERMSTGQGQPPRPALGFATLRAQIVVIPDDRLNTIYVQGTKADRNEVEGLIKMLDVEQMPGMAMLTPTLIAVKNTQAQRVYPIVLQVFQNKLMTTRMPGGESARIGVDAMTNSLVVVAPVGLTEEIRKFAESLDTRVYEEPAEQLHIIQLQKANSTRMQQMLQSILRMSNYPTVSGGGMPAFSAPAAVRPPVRN